MTKTKTPSIKKITDSIEYPYSISLPKTFNTFCDSNNIEYLISNNQVVIQFKNKTQLTTCLKHLKKSKEEASSIIVDGIIRSLKL